MKYYSSICLMVKDEENYINEWLEYHKRLGFQHFYIYDNNSTIPVKSYLNNDDSITIIEWTDKNIDRHKRAFMNCFKKFKNESKWIACIDIDEFIVLKTKQKNINDFLINYEDYGGLGINWLMFGSSNLKNSPETGVLKNYVYRAPYEFNPHEIIKTIVNTKYVKEEYYEDYGIHNFLYNNNYAVNENFEEIKGIRIEPSYNKIQLNHYFLKSKNDMETKIKKGGGNGIKRTIEELEKYDNICNSIYDNTINNIFK